MSIISDFDVAWKPFADRIKSYIIQNPSAELAEIQSFFNRTVRMWEDPSRVQYGFLERYKRNAPMIESEILALLKAFRFNGQEGDRKVSTLPYGCVTLGSGAVGGAVGMLLPEASFLKKMIGVVPTTVVGVLLFSAVGGSIAKSMYDNAMKEKSEAQSKFYVDQIDELYESICSVCNKYS